MIGMDFHRCVIAKREMKEMEQVAETDRKLIGRVGLGNVSLRDRVMTFLEQDSKQFLLFRVLQYFFLEKIFGEPPFRKKAH